MRFLRKISPSPYADSINNVIAYSGEEEDPDELADAEDAVNADSLRLPMPTVQVDTTRTPIAQQRALERSVEIHQRNQRVQEAHSDAVNTVGSNMLAAALGAGVGGGGPGGAALAATVTGVVGTYQSCYVSCHDQSPPKGPGG